jgi:hypothetical protein
MSEPTSVIYRSGAHPTENWEVMQVIYQHEDATGAKRFGNSLVIARAADGAVLRKTDIVLERWEIVTNEEDLRFFKWHFDERDRLAAEQALERKKNASV